MKAVEMNLLLRTDEDAKRSQGEASSAPASRMAQRENDDARNVDLTIVGGAGTIITYSSGTEKKLASGATPALRWIAWKPA